MIVILGPALESLREREGGRDRGREGGEKEEGGEEGRGGEAGAREGRGERQRAGEGAREEEGEGEARLAAGLAAAAQRLLPVQPPTTPREGGASGAHKASESSISNLASWQDLCEAKSRAPQCKQRGGKRESSKGRGENPAGTSEARRGAGSAVSAGGAREASEEAPRAGAREPGPEELRPGAAGGQVPACSPSQGAARLLAAAARRAPCPCVAMSYPQGYLYQPSASLALYSCPAYSTSVISGPRTDELGRSSSGSAFSPYAGSTAFTAPSPGYNSHLQYGADPAAAAAAAFSSYVVSEREPRPARAAGAARLGRGLRGHRPPRTAPAKLHGPYKLARLLRSVLPGLGLGSCSERRAASCLDR